MKIGIPKYRELIKKVKCYEDVCKELGVPVLDESYFSLVSSDQAEKLLAVHQILNIEKLFNGNWKANWNNRDQRKWYPWFTKNEARGGWVFGRSLFHYYFYSGEVGFFETQELSDWVGRTFKDIYIKIIE